MDMNSTTTTSSMNIIIRAHLGLLFAHFYICDDNDALFSRPFLAIHSSHYPPHQSDPVSWILAELQVITQVSIQNSGYK